MAGSRSAVIDRSAELDQADFDTQTVQFMVAEPEPPVGQLMKPPGGVPPTPPLPATIAHDLLTPISTLVTSAGILIADFDELDHQQVRRMVSVIHHRALWLQELVENLLCASVINQGRLVVTKQPADLVQIVEAFRPLIQPLLARKGQVLRLRSTNDSIEVPVDRARIGQVLSNLISNASKFGAHGAPIEVQIEDLPSTVRVSVSDYGPGIPAGAEQDLFHAFVRAGDSGRPGEAGFGLGLAIVKAIVEAHGGCVGAENRRHAGARFWFELPKPQLDQGIDWTSDRRGGDRESAHCRR